MKRWTWVALAAASGACSFPTGEFTLGGANRPDVVTSDNGRTDSGVTDTGAPDDRAGSPDGTPPVDVVAGDDVSDAGAPGDLPTVDADDAGPATDSPDAGAPDDVGPPDDAPAADGGCISPAIACTVVGTGSTCVNPLTSTDHCGRCNYRCDSTNATAACTEGRCVLTCRAGFADCDGDPRNGCEVGLNTVTNCRACGDVCPSSAALNGTPACTSGVCRTTCAPGYADCNGAATDGCETPIANNPANCGVCSRACSAMQGCVGGTCTAFCSAPNQFCGGACVDVQTSAAHCGGCGNACPNPTNAVGACRAGSCGIGTCNANFGDCDGTASNGCEVNVTNTAAHCGGCGRACAFPNANATCASGACAMGTCTGTFRNCDSDVTNGCEVDSSSNILNCGACGAQCRYHPGSNAACTSSRCAPTCNAGYADCDRDPATGCEASLATNLNCGACGRTCTGTTACVRGTCLGPAATVTYVQNAGPAFVDVCSAAGAAHILQGSTMMGSDDEGALVALPFAFTYWGTALAAGSMINVATNGFVSMQPTVSSALQGLIPDPAAPDAVIAALWVDLFTSSQGVCTQVQGLAPNRRFIIQWGGTNYFNPRSGNMSFEVVLNEGSNAVDLVYQRVAAPGPGYMPTIGLESGNGTSGLILNVSGIPCSTASTRWCNVASGSSFRFVPR